MSSSQVIEPSRLVRFSDLRFAVAGLLAALDQLAMRSNLITDKGIRRQQSIHEEYSEIGS